MARKPLYLAGPLLIGAMAATMAFAQPRSHGPIDIGVEYAFPGMAAKFADLKIPAVKVYPEHVMWGRMQKNPDAAIDFTTLDAFVREYQDAGFTRLVVALRSLCPWGVKNVFKNHAPKPEHRELYAKWIAAVVERYDKDGNADMPGLRYPVRDYEIGSEFSSYEPEPVDDYLDMLSLAYKAAHGADRGVRILHAALLTTTAFKDNPQPRDYEKAFAAVPQRIAEHGLADMRKVLDRRDLFDAINFHNIGDPIEIEQIVAWLRYEMKQRKLDKPIIISDTTPTLFIGWGPANSTDGVPGKSLGIIVPPATEADRPRLAKYFQKLIDNDEATVAWCRAFCAADMAKKVIVAAEQGVELIDASFMEDLFFLKLKLARAGAGNSAWGGMVETKLRPPSEQRTVVGTYPAFHAVQQLQSHLQGCDKVRRVPMPKVKLTSGRGNAEARVYEITGKGKRFWFAWLEPVNVLLPEDAAPSAEIAIAVSGLNAAVEPVITRMGQEQAERSNASAAGGTLRVRITPTPVYVYPK